jgi:hypothetical protein
MNEQAMLLAFVLPALGAAFAAGGWVFALRHSRREINGLGGRLNRAIAAIVRICPEDKREEVMMLVLGLGFNGKEG